MLPSLIFTVGSDSKFARYCVVSIVLTLSHLLEEYKHIYSKVLVSSTPECFLP